MFPKLLILFVIIPLLGLRMIIEAGSPAGVLPAVISVLAISLGGPISHLHKQPLQPRRELKGRHG